MTEQPDTYTIAQCEMFPAEAAVALHGTVSHVFTDPAGNPEIKSGTSQKGHTWHMQSFFMADANQDTIRVSNFNVNPEHPLRGGEEIYVVGKTGKHNGKTQITASSLQTQNQVAPEAAAPPPNSAPAGWEKPQAQVPPRPAPAPPAQGNARTASGGLSVASAFQLQALLMRGWKAEGVTDERAASALANSILIGVQQGKIADDGRGLEVVPSDDEINAQGHTPPHTDDDIPF